MRIKTLTLGGATLLGTLSLTIASSAFSAEDFEIRNVPMPDVTNGLQGLTFNSTYESFEYEPSIYILDGKVVDGKSKLKEVVKGSTKGSNLKNLTIDVQRNRGNAIYAKGDTDVTLENVKITLKGNAAGWDENFGVGTAVVVGEGATLTLKNADITSHGIKAGAAAAANGTLKVYDSRLESEGGDVPYENQIPGSGPGYVGAPVPLDIIGTARTTNVVGSGKAYYYNSTIISNGWGALSTDSARPNVYLEVNDSEVFARNNGYGTYSDFSCLVVINNTKMHTASYTGIISVDGKIVLNNVTEDTAVNAILIHAPGTRFTDVGQLEIHGGKYETKDATILVKSNNADILLDGTELKPANGVIIHSQVDISKRAAIMRYFLDDRMSEKPQATGLAGINATMKDMTINGNFEHMDTGRQMKLNFQDTRFKGAIVGTVWAIEDVLVSVDSKSKWTATENSYVTLVNATNPAVFDAPEGVAITAIAGEGTTLSGRYYLPSGGQLIVKSAS